VLPLSNWMRASAALMIVHQFVAFALYVTPLIFMFERLPVGERRRLPGCQSCLRAVRGWRQPGAPAITPVLCTL